MAQKPLAKTFLRLHSKTELVWKVEGFVGTGKIPGVIDTIILICCGAGYYLARPRLPGAAPTELDDSCVPKLSCE